MLALTGVLATLQAAAAWLAGRLGATGGFRDRFVLLSYQVAPAAMISLLLGLGIDLFKLVPAGAAAPVEVGGAGGSGAVGRGAGRHRILAGVGLTGCRAAVAMLPGLAAGLVVAAAWWPAVVAG